MPFSWEAQASESPKRKPWGEAQMVALWCCGFGGMGRFVCGTTPCHGLVRGDPHGDLGSDRFLPPGEVQAGY